MSGPVRVPLSPRLVDQARQFANGDRTPAEPREAATVVLLRDKPPGPAGRDFAATSEIYLLRRQTSMTFAGGMYVFPGGGVDPRDFEERIAWAGPAPEQWAAQLACSEQLARALVCAAVRETFEESGVLLAGASPTEVVADTTGEAWESERAALESRELSMSDFLSGRGLVLRTDLLGAYAAWTTPVFEPKRFATWFFVAALPAGQRTRDVSRESDHVTWLAADTAVARVDEGEVAMMPPTYLTCLDVARTGAPSTVFARTHGRVLEMHTPQVQLHEGEYRLSVPASFQELLA